MSTTSTTTAPALRVEPFPQGGTPAEIATRDRKDAADRAEEARVATRRAAAQAASAAADATARGTDEAATQSRPQTAPRTPSAATPAAETATRPGATAASNTPPARPQSSGLRRFGLRRQAAPTMAINIAPDMVDDLQRMIAEFSDLEAIMAHDKNPTGVDGQYGPRTFLAIARIATEAGIAVNDIPKIKFFDTNDALYNQWNSALRKNQLGNETPVQVVQRVEQEQGPSPEELAQRAAAERAAAEAARIAAAAAAAQAARDAANNRVPVAIRGTQYDPRYLATLSTAELINVSKDGLHGIGEISRGFLGMGSYHRNGRLGPVTSDKLLDFAREKNLVPEEQDTLTRRELERTVASLGEAVARRTHLALPQLAPDRNPMLLPAPVPAATPTDAPVVAAVAGQVPVALAPTPTLPTGAVQPTPIATPQSPMAVAMAQADTVVGGMADGANRLVVGRATNVPEDLVAANEQLRSLPLEDRREKTTKIF